MQIRRSTLLHMISGLQNAHISHKWYNMIPNSYQIHTKFMPIPYQIHTNMIPYSSYQYDTMDHVCIHTLIHSCPLIFDLALAFIDEVILAYENRILSSILYDTWPELGSIEIDVGQ